MVDRQYQTGLLKNRDIDEDGDVQLEDQTFYFTNPNIKNDNQDTSDFKRVSEAQMKQFKRDSKQFYLNQNIRLNQNNRQVQVMKTTCRNIIKEHNIEMAKEFGVQNQLKKNFQINQQQKKWEMFQERRINIISNYVK
jgi:hypothetical protein